MCLLELNFLKSVTNNDPILIKEFVTDFLIEELEFEGEIKLQAQCRNVKNIEKAIHKFRSCIKVIGIPCLEKEIDLLEYYLKNHDFDNINCGIQHMQIILDMSKKELELCLQ